MNTAISQTSMIRGADGRLYAIGAQGVTEVTEARAGTRSALRAGDFTAFDSADHEASRTYVNPGL